MEMATQVLIAHTGQRLEIDTAQFQSYARLLSLCCCFALLD